VLEWDQERGQQWGKVWDLAFKVDVVSGLLGQGVPWWQSVVGSWIQVFLSGDIRYSIKRGPHLVDDGVGVGSALECDTEWGFY
jgi:hypothetical protein